MPRIPVKKPPVPSPAPDVQMQMAEIAVQEAEEKKETAIIEEDAEETLMAVSEPVPEMLHPDTLAVAIKMFSEQQRSMIIKSLLPTLPVVLNDKKVTFTLGSKAQMDMIEPVRIDILAFLRKYFSDNAVELDIVVDATIEAVSAQPYSAKEKLNAMVAEKPDLMYLIEKLNLKIK